MVKKTEEKRRPGRPKTVASAAKGDRATTGVLLDKQLWRRFKAQAMIEGKTTGELLEQVMSDYLDKHKR